MPFSWTRICVRSASFGIDHLLSKMFTDTFICIYLSCSLGNESIAHVMLLYQNCDKQWSTYRIDKKYGQVLHLGWLYWDSNFIDATTRAPSLCEALCNGLLCVVLCANRWIDEWLGILRKCSKDSGRFWVEANSIELPIVALEHQRRCPWLQQSNSYLANEHCEEESHQIRTFIVMSWKLCILIHGAMAFMCCYK